MANCDLREKVAKKQKKENDKFSHRARVSPLGRRERAFSSDQGEEYLTNKTFVKYIMTQNVCICISTKNTFTTNTKVNNDTKGGGYGF